MTEKEQYEVKKFLESKGLGKDSIEGAVKSIKYHERTENLKNSEEVSRARECIDFKPNPGKATFTQIGETQTYVVEGSGGLPIYKEDVEMIKKSTPLAKKLVEIQKTKPLESVEEKPFSEMTVTEKLAYLNLKDEKEEETLRTLRDTIDEVYEIDPEELNTGPDTTENIHEIAPDEIPDNVKRVPEIVKQAIQKSRGIKENENMTHDDENKKAFESREQWEENLSNVPPEMVNPGPGFWEEYYRKKKTPKIIIDDLMYPSKEAVDKAMEKYNKNVSCPQDYSSILRQMDNTHTRKNSDYGDAAYKGYKKYGDYYFLVQLHNKLTRLESLTINNKKPQVEDESIDDTLLDMANYAVMYLESRHRND